MAFENSERPSAAPREIELLVNAYAQEIRRLIIGSDKNIERMIERELLAVSVVASVRNLARQISRRCSREAAARIAGEVRA